MSSHNPRNVSRGLEQPELPLSLPHAKPHKSNGQTQTNLVVNCTDSQHNGDTVDDEIYAEHAQVEIVYQESPTPQNEQYPRRSAARRRPNPAYTREDLILPHMGEVPERDTLETTANTALQHRLSPTEQQPYAQNQRHPSVTNPEMIKAWQALGSQTSSQVVSPTALRSKSHENLLDAVAFTRTTTPKQDQLRGKLAAHKQLSDRHMATSLTPNPYPTASLPRPRHRRKKSSSANAIIQAWQEQPIEPVSPSRLSSIRKKFQSAFVHPVGPLKTSTSANTLTDLDKMATMTPMDLELLRNLEDDYSAAAQLNSVRNKAQRIWAFRAALTSIFFMAVYFMVGVMVFLELADGSEEWTALDTLLFSVYTATSAGFGHLTPPETSAYYAFNTVYLLVGIAAMAVMIAQVFQWMELEAASAQDRRRARQLAEWSNGRPTQTTGMDRLGERCRTFFQETSMGHFLFVSMSLSFVTLVGAIPIGILEEWTFWQSLNFGAVSMTTVGYGDLVPETRIGKGLCLIWLPCNVLFSSIYMGSVASWYLNLSARNIQRIQRALHRRQNLGGMHHNALEGSLAVPQANLNRRKSLVIDGKEVDSDDDNSEDANDPYLNRKDSGDSLESDEALGDPEGGFSERSDWDIGVEAGETMDSSGPTVVIENISSTLTTMKDIIEVVHKTKAAYAGMRPPQISRLTSDPMEFLSLQDKDNGGGPLPKPSLALRVLVKERMASIIAYEICGGAHHVDVKDTFIVVKVGQWKEVVRKWLIPSGAWKAFRAAALEAMMLVGERTLLQQGPAALFDLTPDEFHSLFSPLVAAMGESSTLDGWLKSTDELANEFLRMSSTTSTTNSTTPGKGRTSVVVEGKQHRKLTVEDQSVNIPQSQTSYFTGRGKL